MLMNNDIRMPQRSGSAGNEPPHNDEEPSFSPPETVVQQEELIDMSGIPEEATVDSKNPKKQITGFKNIPNPIIKLKTWVKKLSKKQQILFGVVSAVVLVLIGGGLVMALHKPKPAPKPAPVVTKQEVKKEPPKPTTEPSRLTGVQVPVEYNLLPVTGVMIENSPDARPQSGLDQAGVVFEAVAEGGITRFLTLFQEAQPDYLGPVRSVRPYYLRWLQGFDAAVAHVGGSGEALNKIATEGIKDLDQFYNGAAYQRISQRYAPHNVYTSLGGLLAIEKDKGWTSSTFTGFARKAEKALPTPTIKTIDLNISGPLYNAHYDYDVASNKYLRSEGGQPHMDEKTAKQLSPKVVIGLVMPKGIDADGVHTTYANVGSGKAYIFQDGGMTEGTWSKPSDKDQVKFLDATGKPIGLNPGQTWISAVGNESDVTRQP